MEYLDCGNLYKEIREYKNNDVLTQKRRQQLRANNHELRQLERHLQSAAANKQLDEQLRNATQLKESDRRRKREENVQIAAERELDRESVLKQEELERLTKKKRMEILNYEISKAHEKRRKDFEDAYKDPDEIKRIVKEIEAEAILKRKEKELFREKCKREMEENCKTIILKQQLEKERDVEENIRNFSYQAKCDRMKSDKEAERKRVLDEKEELSKLLGEKLTFDNFEKEERERLLLSLSIHERKAKELQDLKEELTKVANVVRKLGIEYDNYCSEKKTRKFEEEDKFRIQNLRYMEERDKLWQLSEERRRRILIDHNKELREIIEQRRCVKANQIAKKISELDKIRTDNQESCRLVEQERIRMLNSVPRDVLRYLPPGALKSSDEELLKFCKK